MRKLLSGLAIVAAVGLAPRDLQAWHCGPWACFPHHPEVPMRRVRFVVDAPARNGAQHGTAAPGKDGSARRTPSAHPRAPQGKESR